MKNNGLCMLLVTSMLVSSKVSEATPAITINVDGADQKVINTLSDNFFGHNYWMWAPKWGNPIVGTEDLVSDLGVKFLRLGGTQVDMWFPDTVKEKTIDDYVSYANKIKAEPLFQVPVGRFSNTNERADNALKMLELFKKKKPDVKYVSIGNEPDLYNPDVANNKDLKADHLKNYTKNDYYNDYNAVAKKLKEKNQSLKLIGLELSWKKELWVPDFVSNCKDNIDMISIHYYPIDPSKCTYDFVRSCASEIETFYSSTRSLIDQNAGGKKIPLIIGETNISWDGDSTKNKLSASPGTLNAALWFADFVGVSSAQKDLFSIMPWSIREGWKLGFIDGNGKPRPVYYTYQMFANNSKKKVIHKQVVNGFVRAYAYKDDKNNVSLFTVNWDTVSSYQATIKFSNILENSSYDYKIPPQSISCINFSSDFKKKEIITYSKGQSQPVPVIESSWVVPNNSNGISLSYNKNNSILTIYSSKEITNTTISLTNLQGKEIRKINSVNINKGNTSVQMSKVSLPAGLYLLKLSKVESVISGKSVELVNIN